MNPKISMLNCIGINSADTHNLEAYSKLFRMAMNKTISKNILGNVHVVDPFARMCLWGTKRNDINPNFLGQYTTHCMDALDFINSEATSQTDIVLLDPPFSDRQSKEEYGSSNLYANPKYMSDLGKSIFRILKAGGYVIKCGFNSNPPSKGFTLIHLYVCNMGGSRNDILISLWRKNQSTLTKMVGLA
jgi:hypothetical protein